MNDKLATTWVKVQHLFIARFNVVWNERHAIFSLKDKNKIKYEYMEYYYDIFLQLCVVMPN